MGFILVGKNPGLSGIFTEAAACTFKGSGRRIYLPEGSCGVWAGFLPENLFSGGNSFPESLRKLLPELLKATGAGFIFRQEVAECGLDFFRKTYSPAGTAFRVCFPLTQGSNRGSATGDFKRPANSVLPEFDCLRIFKVFGFTFFRIFRLRF